MTKEQRTRIIRILLFVGTITSMFFVPWILVKAWILPLPATIQEQVDEAIGHGFDGMIVYMDLDDVMSGYYVGVEEDLKTEEYGMLATAEDVGIFLRALNDGSVFEEGEQEIYTSIYVYKHGGLVPGYQSLAEYYKDIDAVVVQFVNTTDFEGYEWNLSQIVFGRIEKILRKQKS